LGTWQVTERRFWVEFEDLVGKILEAHGYNVMLRARVGSVRVREIDIVASKADGVVLPVEVKLGLREKVTLAALRDASSIAGSLRDFADGTKPLLVYGAYIEASRRDWAENEFQIQIWDRDILMENARLERNNLERFFEEFVQQLPKPSVSLPAMRMVSSVPELVEPGQEPPPEPQGEALIAKLAHVAPGKKDAKAYEAICRDIISYLFGDDLRDVRSQKTTTDGINIYDLVYRVSPKHPFWVTLTRDFRARVVLFECKNYRKPIGPMQVFTTERYLSASALRPICFVLSRKPPHQHAVHAASGAMRESGKLLVFLSDADLIKMLRARDVQLKEGGTREEMQANDPTEVLDQTIYDFIAGMPR
jgi:Restriction endonuclease